MTDEAWLWRNPKALASVLEGLAQAARGEFAEPPDEKGEQMGEQCEKCGEVHPEGWVYFRNDGKEICIRNGETEYRGPPSLLDVATALAQAWGRQACLCRQLVNRAEIDTGTPQEAHAQCLSYSEKGDAMDDATAKRIAEYLRTMCWVADGRVLIGTDDLAKAIQEAAEPPPREPGLYFVRQAGRGLHAQRFGYQEGRPAWLSWYAFLPAPEPDGEILSGPHTCEELLEAVQK